MKIEKLRPILILVNIVIINWFIIRFIGLDYPFLGHDYSLTIPSLLDTALHYRLNGLAIQWFTPSFGGGIPAFPNPNNSQFSLLALLSVFLNPWQAVIFFIVIYVSTGFIACEYFLHHTLKLNWTTSILGAVFFSANGYIIENATVGHLGYLNFPLLPIFLILLLDESLAPPIAAATMGVALGVIIHLAGYFIIIVFGLSLLITLPIVYIYDPAFFKWKSWMVILPVGAVIGLVISASKLAAVMAFMRFFPRSISDYYPTTPLLGLAGLVLQLLGTMNLAPLFQIVGLKPDILPAIFIAATGADYGYWEFDMSITPIVFAILLTGLYVFFRQPQKYLSKLLHGQKKIAWVLLALSLWIAVEFTIAKGLIYPLFQHLPILSSLHVNVRFAAAFIFPLVLGAALIYNHLPKNQKTSLVFIAINILAVLPLGAYFLFKSDLFYRFYDVRQGQKFFDQMQSDTSLLDVTKIGIQKDDTQALLNHTSNLNPYDPIFGYNLEYFHPKITSGSIWSISNGYYNMTDPTGYVFPEINDNHPFERFRVADKDTLALFAKHIQPAWKIPIYQRILDWVSGSVFVIATGFIAFYFGKRLFFKTS